MTDKDGNPSCARKTPCASCPYRKGVPSGVWHESEYKKLPKFDGPIIDQMQNEVGNAVFYCHHQSGEVCAGWVGHREHPYDLMGVRIGVSRGRLDLSILDYSTDVPLFATGREAAEHGLRDKHPGPEAQAVIEKVKHLPNVTTITEED